MAGSSNEEQDLAAALMLIKDLRKQRTKEVPFAWVREIYNERNEKGTFHIF